MESASIPSARSSAIGLLMRHFRARYGLVLEWVVGALMVILFVEVTIGVVYRTLGVSLIWYDELASVLLAWLTFYGSALASVKRAHIGCPELVEKMPHTIRQRVNIVAQILVIAFFVMLGGVGLWIMPVLADDYLVSLPAISMGIVQSVIPISSVLIIIAEVTHLVDLINDSAPPPTTESGIALADGLH